MIAPAPATAGPPAVRLIGIHKRFGAVQANRDVTFDVAAGSIHGLIGENGAGKSTLMGVLYGLHAPDAGRIEIDGRALTLGHARDAIAAGIGMVHQHFMLVERFTVLENIVLGAEDSWQLGTSLARARREVLRLSDEYGLTVDPDARVRDLPVGVLQRVEILKALVRGARVLILDEPTGVLTPQETEQLMRMLATLKSRGTTILLITHKLKEVLAITDRVTVMRAGQVVATRETAGCTEAELAELMVGRAVRAVGDPGVAARAVPRRRGDPVLDVASLTWRDPLGVARLSDIDLRLHAGEIVGVAGVSGNGQSELLALLAGLLPVQQGSIRIASRRDGEPAHRCDAHHPPDPRLLRELGVAHVPEDRHKLGLVLRFPAWESAVLGYHDDAELRLGPRWSRWTGLMDHRRMRARCRRMMDVFDVRPRDVELACAKFSGGNQQKLIIAREFDRQPRVLLIGQPTRGVDIGAIETIHREILQLRDAGCAVLLVSTELDEIMALSDRIVVMCQGRITGNFERADADEARIGLCMGQVGSTSAFDSTQSPSALPVDAAAAPVLPPPSAARDDGRRSGDFR
ncbi:ABC transporter ATP-binding protein [Leptothrix discophora]|uniref:ABC transporter ATP-binding protein n=1 Tax=Leptothrix discophora TaxID=89 RepID=A0ABT9FZX8_LEPDI|nr:ABC transporter ATP-binding protein [Leptothrix discophora]MDP4299779.1 ABC transporter ATP-binding protein [Leptothrix discophora]